MLSELKAFLEIVDRATLKRDASAMEQRRSRVLAGVYRVGKEGTTGASLTDLLSTGFTKAEVSEATEFGQDRGWLTDASTFGGMAWMLTPRGRLYVEGLLEDGQTP